MQIICDTFPEVSHRFSLFFSKDIKTGEIVALMNFVFQKFRNEMQITVIFHSTKHVQNIP